MKASHSLSNVVGHPPVRGENVKTYRWDRRLQRQNLNLEVGEAFIRLSDFRLYVQLIPLSVAARGVSKRNIFSLNYRRCYGQ